MPSGWNNDAYSQRLYAKRVRTGASEKDLTGVCMTWSDLTQNWAASYRALCTEFPKLEPSAMPFLKADQDRFENYLAATHDMTLKEAQIAFDAFLNRQVKARHTA